jgi:hypothetical protein
MSRHTANTELQAKLRGMIDDVGLKRVSKAFTMGRAPLARYLADLYLHTSTFRTIEALVTSALAPGAARRYRPEVPTEPQVKLRRMIEATSLGKVSEKLELGTETLARYLADLNLHESSWRAIEARVAAASVEMPVPVTRGRPGLSQRQSPTVRA